MMCNHNLDAVVRPMFNCLNCDLFDGMIDHDVESEPRCSGSTHGSRDDSNKDNYRSEWIEPRSIVWTVISLNA